MATLVDYGSIRLTFMFLLFCIWLLWLGIWPDTQRRVRKYTHTFNGGKYTFALLCCGQNWYANIWFVSVFNSLLLISFEFCLSTLLRNGRIYLRDLNKIKKKKYSNRNKCWTTNECIAKEI